MGRGISGNKDRKSGNWCHFDGKAERSKRKADSVSVGFSLSAEYEVKCIWSECDHE